jgi:hypothetical protein
VAFGDVLGVVVLLYGEGPHTVRLAADHLRIGDDEASSEFHTLIDGQPALLYLTYPRRDERPDSWRASLVVDETSEAEVSLSF